MNSALAEAMAQVGFLWWDDALSHARWLAGKSGRRRRVVWDRRRDLWVVRPAPGEALMSAHSVPAEPLQPLRDWAIAQRPGVGA